MPLAFSTAWALIPILLFIHSDPAHGASCYFPNGDPVNNDEYTPCRNDTDYTMCCRTGGVVPDTCDDNGLCYNICDQMGSGCHNDPGTYWRESCTDRSWLSPYCLRNVCTDGTINGTASDNFPVTRCTRNSKWCCGAMASEDCCDLDTDEQFGLMSVLSASAGSTSSTISVSATVTRTDTTISTDTTTDKTTAATTDSSPQIPTAADDQEDNNGALDAEGKVGLGVGLGLGIPFVLATLAAVFMYRKRKHITPLLVPGGKTERYFEKPELDANATVAELDATNRIRPAEMES